VRDPYDSRHQARLRDSPGDLTTIDWLIELLSGRRKPATEPALPTEPVAPATNDAATLLAFHEAYAEWSYTMMYETASSTTASARYSDAKEAFSEAIRLAMELGRGEDAARLEKRREHVQSVYRSQF
jgi:hypothetical protein